MENQELRERILNEMNEYIGMIGGYGESDEFNNIVWDTLDFIELIMGIEYRFEIEINDESVDETNFDTIGQFIDWIIKFF